MDTNNSLESLRQDLWTRWKAQFDRFPDVLEIAEPSVRTVYARTFLYDLKKYTPAKFPAGGRTSPKPYSDYRNYIYQLDAQGRPVHMRMRDDSSDFTLEGIYQYGPDEVEYVSFNAQTGIPAQYNRVTLRDQHVITYQGLMLVGGAALLHGMTKPDLLDCILGNSRHYWVDIEMYHVEEGLVRSADGYGEGWGMEPKYFTLSYFYSNQGKLERIVQHRSDGDERIIFAARSKTSLKDLSDNLSSRIADRTLEALRNRHAIEPLAALELAYRSVYQYVPSLVTYAKWEAIPALSPDASFDQIEFIQFSDEDFEPEMIEFVERITSADRYTAGSKMLRNAAKLVTERAPAQIPTVENFVAFAIDWEMEGEEVAKILKECGADPKWIKKVVNMVPPDL